MKVPFASPSTRDGDNPMGSSARLLNWFREVVGQRVMLRSHLGTEAFATIDGSRELAYPPAAMQSFDGNLYWLHPDGLMRGSDATVIPIADRAEFVSEITGGASVVPWGVQSTMAVNNGNLTMTDGPAYRVYDGSTVTTPTSGAFFIASSCFTINQRTLVTEFGGRRVKWSDPADPTTFNALNFATKEGRTDNIRRGAVVNNSVIIFGFESLEFWQQLSNGDFQARSGGIVDIGLFTFGAMALGRNTLMFVGTDKKVYITEGQGMTPVSIAGVESAINNAFAIQCTYFEDRGHKFFALNFPYRPSWIYDLTTGEWSERSEGYDFGRWTAFVAAEFDGDYYIGVPDAIHKLTRNNVDVSGPLMRRCISETVQNQGQRFRVSQLTFQGDFGDHQTEPQLTLRTSADYGQTFGRRYQRGLGKRGAFLTRPVFRGLGQYRQLTVEATITDPEDVILDAEAII